MIIRRAVHWAIFLVLVTRVGVKIVVLHFEDESRVDEKVRVEC
jgi:hypothetical protein